MAIPLILAGLGAMARTAAPYVARSLVTPTKLGVGIATAENAAQKEMGWDLPSISLNGIIGDKLADSLYTAAPTDHYIASKERALDAERVARNEALFAKRKADADMAMDARITKLKNYTSGKSSSID